jgi:tetratricopeptide (TPR) repeat protein
MRTYLCALLAALAMAPALSAQTPPADRKEAQLRSARAYAAQGQYNDAIARYNEYLADNPDDAAVLSEAGAALLKAGRADEAVVTLAESLRRKPHQPETIRLIADACIARKDPAMAIEMAQLGVIQYPQDLAMRLKLAEVNALAGRKEDAIWQYRQVLTQDPGNATATKALIALGAAPPTTLPPTTLPPTTTLAPVTTMTLKATTTTTTTPVTTTAKATTTTLKPTTTTLKPTTTTLKPTITTAAVATTTLKATTTTAKATTTTTGAATTAVTPAAAAAKMKYEDDARAREAEAYQARRAAVMKEQARKAQREQAQAAQEARERDAAISPEKKARAEAEKKAIAAEIAAREARTAKPATTTTTGKR